MKDICLSRILALVALFLVSLSTAHSAPPGTGWSLAFSDEFNDTTVDSSKWKISKGQDWSKDGIKCWFYPENVNENGNALVIENKWLPSPGPNGELYSGATIISNQKFTHGYIEARTRLDWVDGHFWPTFWMNEYRADGSANEFDIMEYNHWSTYPTQSHHFPKKEGVTTVPSNASVNEWHVWGVLWTENEITFYVDGIKQFSSERPQVAATDLLPLVFSCSPNLNKNPARTGQYPRFFVDWVRVWQGGILAPVVRRSVKRLHSSRWATGSM